jgi:hypothetical protein
MTPSEDSTATVQRTAAANEQDLAAEAAAKRHQREAAAKQAICVARDKAADLVRSLTDNEVLNLGIGDGTTARSFRHTDGRDPAHRADFGAQGVNLGDPANDVQPLAHVDTTAIVADLNKQISALEALKKPIVPSDVAIVTAELKSIASRIAAL